MPAANNINLSEETLNEIEAVSLSKYHEKVLDELEKDAKNFKNFKDLEYAEYNARILAEDYVTKIRKNLIRPNPEIESIAKGFAHKRYAYEVIQEAKKDPARLQNPRLAGTLIMTVKDCVNGASILATHRQQTRQNLINEQILENQDIMKQGIHLLVQNMNLNNQQQSNARVANTLPRDAPNATAAPNVLPIVVPTIPQRIERRQPPTANALKAQGNQNGPSWIVSENETRNIYNSNLTVDKFVRAFLLKLFSDAEILMTLSKEHEEKKNEFFKVLQRFFPTENASEQFEKIMKNLRFQKRQKIFKTLNAETGYGITSNGVDYYYKLPLNASTECFNHPNCSIGSRIRTKPVGNMKVAEKCGQFEYLLLIEKPGLRSTVKKLMPNGELFDI